MSVDQQKIERGKLYRMNSSFYGVIDAIIRVLDISTTIKGWDSQGRLEERQIQCDVLRGWWEPRMYLYLPDEKIELEEIEEENLFAEML